MRRTKNSSKASPFRLLWLVVGILVGVFISSLMFLKKNVTIVTNGAQTEITNPPQPKTISPHAGKTNNHSVAPVKPTSPETVSSDQYDFYTMLPNMQVNKNNATPNGVTSSAQVTTATKIPTTAANTAPSGEAATPTPPNKPLKSLDAAEQSLLAGKNKGMLPPPDSNLATASPTSTPASKTPTATNVPTAVSPSTPPLPTSNKKTTPSTATVTKKIKPVAATPSSKTRYSITLGTFNSASDADGRKAELALAGFDHVKVQNFDKNGVTWYRVVIDNFRTEDQAKTALNKLQDSKFNGVISST